MSNSFMDRNQLVGYDFDKKELVVTMEEKMATKMAADGWPIQKSTEVGFFITIGYEEVESA